MPLRIGRKEEKVLVPLPVLEVSGIAFRDLSVGRLLDWGGGRGEVRSSQFFPGGVGGGP